MAVAASLAGAAIAAMPAAPAALELEQQCGGEPRGAEFVMVGDQVDASARRAARPELVKPAIRSTSAIDDPSTLRVSLGERRTHMRT